MLDLWAQELLWYQVKAHVVNFVSKLKAVLLTCRERSFATSISQKPLMGGPLQRYAMCRRTRRKLVCLTHQARKASTKGIRKSPLLPLGQLYILLVYSMTLTTDDKVGGNFIIWGCAVAEAAAAEARIIIINGMLTLLYCHCLLLSIYCWWLSWL